MHRIAKVSFSMLVNSDNREIHAEEMTGSAHKYRREGDLVDRLFSVVLGYFLLCWAIFCCVGLLFVALRHYLISGLQLRGVD
jgi:hypothetical protein